MTIAFTPVFVLLSEFCQNWVIYHKESNSKALKNPRRLKCCRWMKQSVHCQFIISTCVVIVFIPAFPQTQSKLTSPYGFWLKIFSTWHQIKGNCGESSWHRGWTFDGHTASSASVSLLMLGCFGKGISDRQLLKSTYEIMWYSLV